MEKYAIKGGKCKLRGRSDQRSDADPSGICKGLVAPITLSVPLSLWSAPQGEGWKKRGLGAVASPPAAKSLRFPAVEQMERRPPGLLEQANSLRYVQLLFVGRVSPNNANVQSWKIDQPR